MSKAFDYYFGMVLPAIADTLNLIVTKESIHALHEMFKELFGVESISKSKCNTKERRDFIQNVIVWSIQEWGCEIPDSNDPDNYKNLSLEDLNKIKDESRIKASRR